MRIDRSNHIVDPDELAALAALVAPRVTALVLAHVMGALAGVAKPASYSDRRGLTPPGYSDELGKERVRACPHAIRRGRWVVVDREAFEAWERSQLPSPVAVALAPPPSKWTAAAALARAGLRMTK